MVFCPFPGPSKPLKSRGSTTADEKVKPSTIIDYLPGGLYARVNLFKEVSLTQIEKKYLSAVEAKKFRDSIASRDKWSHQQYLLSKVNTEPGRLNL